MKSIPMATLNASNEISRIFKDLREKSQAKQKDASKKLAELYSSFSSEYNEEIYPKLIDMLKSNEKHEVMGCFNAILKLVKCIRDTQTIHFVHRFMPIIFQLLGSTDIDIITKAAMCIGQLAKLGGSVKGELVEGEVTSAILWISIKDNPDFFGYKNVDNKKLAGLLVLKEFCANAPIVSYNKLFADKDTSPRKANDSNYTKVIDLMIDPKEQIKEAAYFCLKAALGILASRERSNEIMLRIYDQAKEWISSSDQNKIYGGIMVVDSLIECNIELLKPKYLEICKTIFSYNGNALLIKNSIISIIPKLANIMVSLFTSMYLDQGIKYMLSYIKARTLTARNISMTSLGELSLIIEKATFMQYFDKIYELIEEEVIRAKKPFCIEAIECIKMLSKNYNEQIISKPNIMELIENMFSAGLCNELVAAMNELSSTSKVWVRIYIQVCMINAISFILMQYPFNFINYSFLLDMAESDSTNGPQLHTRKISKNSGEENKSDEESSKNLKSTITIAPQELIPQEDKDKINALSTKIVGIVHSSIQNPVSLETKRNYYLLALKVLGSFNFSYLADSLIYFIQDNVLKFLDEDDTRIKKEAIITGCSISIRPDSINPTVESMIDNILNRFLTVAITDSDYKARVNMLRNLNEKFDPFLSHIHHLKFLFTCFNDNIFEVKKCTLKILGRLIPYNPSTILPYLRNQLVRLISKLVYSEDNAEKDESARLLNLMIMHTPSMIKSYTDSILRALLTSLKSTTNPSLITTICEGLGSLSVIARESIKQSIREIVSVLIDNIKDQSNQNKRQVSLLALSRIVENTGYNIQLYYDYPHIFKIIKKLLHVEASQQTRVLVVKLLGALGAINPTYEKQISLRTGNSDNVDMDAYFDMMDKMHFHENAVATLHKTDNMYEDVSKIDNPLYEKETVTAFIMNKKAQTFNNESYHITIALKSLMKVLTIPTLKDHHQLVLRAVNYIFKTLTRECVPYLPLLIPPILNLIKGEDVSLKEPLLTQLQELINCIKEDISEYCPIIFEIYYDQIKSTSNKMIQILLLDVVKVLNKYLPKVVSKELYRLIPSVLNLLQYVEKQKELCIKVLSTIKEMAEHMDEFIHLIIPAMLHLSDNPSLDVDYKLASISVLFSLIPCQHFSEYVVNITHTLIRQIESTTYSMLGSKIMTLFQSILIAMPQDFLIFVPHIRKRLFKLKISNHEFEQTLNKIFLKGFNYIPSREQLKLESSMNEEPGLPTSPSPKRTPDFNLLLKEFDTSKCSIAEDWVEWMKKTSLELFKQSPSHVLYAISSLAEVYEPIVAELYNIAFVSCTKEMTDIDKEKLICHINNAFNNNSVPVYILQTILNLAEFMEHEEHSIPLIDISTLGTLAEKCSAYAKALYYREIEFESNPTETIESLLKINYDLQQSEAADGLLSFTSKNFSIDMNEEWYQKLHKWEKALMSYRVKVLQDPKSQELLIGKMQCFKALSDWSNLDKSAEALWGVESEWTIEEREVLKPKVADLACCAAFNLKKWDKLQKCVKFIPSHTYERMFYEALIGIFNQKYKEAEEFIGKARSILESKVTSLFSESYSRVYPMLVELQHLQELEEVVKYKQSQDENLKQSIQKIWDTRLEYMEKEIDVFQQAINIRSLVLDPQKDIDIRIKYSNLCIKNDKILFALDTLTEIKEKYSDIPPLKKLKVEYTLAKCLFAKKNQKEAYDIVRLLTFDEQIKQYKKLRSRCYYKLAEWEPFLNNNNKTFDSVQNLLELSKMEDPNYYKAWYAMAINNYKEVTNHKSKETANLFHVKTAMQSFVKAISLGGKDITKTLQNILRLMKLWLLYGDEQEVEKIVRGSFQEIDINMWLHVIPQILARIEIPNATVRKTLLELLEKLGQHHPQALIYPLAVLTKSTSEERAKAASKLMNKMKIHSNELIIQCNTVAHELNRCAILLCEIWVETIYEASRMFIGACDANTSVNTLQKGHKLMESPPSTMSEIAFYQSYESDLKEAEQWIIRYTETKNEYDLNNAWMIYFSVYCSLNDKINNMETLELKNISPLLLETKNCEISIPGMYNPGKKVVKISGFNPILKVLKSKQHPRKLSIYGSDGKEYFFLLKGHEDIRQDERAMQLFGLVNTLLAIQISKQYKDLCIRRYIALPLSPKTGLIGWVEDSDTINQLIKEYRTTFKVIDKVETKLMSSMCASFESCRFISKVEIFRYAMDQTYGQDLCKLFWLKSKNSEEWLEHRITYTRSLAVMSMVGYILGLGDRHPSNIMIERSTGKIVHIDFGDCFEVAMRREKFPEKIPFRLTRMLIKAMEVSGIEGNYRTTCEKTMKMLRENKESLLAILEAFIYDPLINFHLLTPNIMKYNDKAKGDIANKLGDIKEANAPKHKIDSTEKSLMLMLGPEGKAAPQDMLNAAAKFAYDRIIQKLSGTEFISAGMDVVAQVDRLIKEATSDENLAQCYMGWCPFW